jgi:hypothetical protein
MWMTRMLHPMLLLLLVVSGFMLRLVGGRGSNGVLRVLIVTVNEVRRCELRGLGSSLNRIVERPSTGVENESSGYVI